MTTALEQAGQAFHLGTQAAEAGRLDEAVRHFETALALAPGRPSVLVNLGITLFRLGRAADAVPVLRQAAEVDAASADVWAYLGLAHEALADWQPASDALRRAVELAPQQAGLWLSYGRSLLELKATGPALRAFDRAVAVNPELAQAWSERGGLLRELGRLPEAAESFEKALALGADPTVNQYYLASVRGDGAPAAPPRVYVEALFDQYADDFERHLVGDLRYQAFKTLVQPLLQPGRRYASVLDLGCGSGLCGRLVQPQADVVDGVDLSQAMLTQARQLGGYRELVHADIAEFLAQAQRSDDLVLAADVFVYVGELTGIAASVRRILRPGGCFAFSVEQADAGQDLQLRASLRYAHSEAYVRRLAQAHGFAVGGLTAGILRYDHGSPIRGLYVYLNG